MDWIALPLSMLFLNSSRATTHTLLHTSQGRFWSFIHVCNSRSRQFIPNLPLRKPVVLCLWDLWWIFLGPSFRFLYGMSLFCRFCTFWHPSTIHQCKLGASPLKLMEVNWYMSEQNYVFFILLWIGICASYIEYHL